MQILVQWRLEKEMRSIKSSAIFCGEIAYLLFVYGGCGVKRGMSLNSVVGREERQRDSSEMQTTSAWPLFIPMMLTDWCRHEMWSFNQRSMQDDVGCEMQLLERGGGLFLPALFPPAQKGPKLTNASFFYLSHPSLCTSSTHTTTDKSHDAHLHTSFRVSSTRQTPGRQHCSVSRG